MINVRALILVLSFGLAAPAAAQDLPSARLYPGSIGTSAGTLSPSEAGNFISSTTIDQAISLKRSGSLFVLGYASVTQRNDTAGYSWNNNTPLTVGARVAKTWASGVLQVNAGVGFVANASTDANVAPVGPIGYVSYWAGWHNPRAHPNRFVLAFPGHVWASSGMVTPLEPRNWISSASFEEGMTLFRYRHIGVIPFAALSAVRDTRGNAWNNKSVGDAGIKLQRFVPGGVIEGGVAARAESYSTTNITHTGPAAFINFWLGWDPRRTHSE